jgi:four helix bundle protein
MTHRQDLKKRTKEFAGSIIRLYVKLPKRRGEVEVVGKQMLRSGTSVASNRREASRARSRVDFVVKIAICLQELDETQLWLELLRDDCQIANAEIQQLWDEADELIAIFVVMSRNTRERGL